MSAAAEAPGQGGGAVDSGSVQAFCQAAAALPPRLRREAMALTAGEQSAVEELRLRAGRPMSAVLPGGTRQLEGPPVTRGELEQLVETAGAVTVEKMIQSREQIHPATYLGRGKLEELRQRLEEIHKEDENDNNTAGVA